jgi:hypothetical protein
MKNPSGPTDPVRFNAFGPPKPKAQAKPQGTMADAVAKAKARNAMRGC